jgi:hypothetical protein
MRIVLVVVGVLAGICAANAQGWDSRNSGFGNSRGGSQSYGTGSNPNGHFVQPHSRSDGSYNSGGYRSNPNSSQFDNYGSRGNVNPYSGSVGTRSPRF